ncbi:hypothetical protein COCON_G00183380 [Conger conger]|uniref:Uncharacterized protein n=1 Tax=Conger conger TaxID=82655 RepID=A0A9Q1D652_CONCO|nr:hypothetical protein COCON_G00183380 [Conger conger]
MYSKNKGIDLAVLILLEGTACSFRQENSRHAFREEDCRRGIQDVLGIHDAADGLRWLLVCLARTSLHGTTETT